MTEKDKEELILVGQRPKQTSALVLNLSDSISFKLCDTLLCEAGSAKFFIVANFSQLTPVQ